MAHSTALIHVEPENIIKFIGPFNNSTVSTDLKLTNRTYKKVFFKIKTTAPRSYCVCPNNGMLYPKDTEVVQIKVQPFDYKPSDKCVNHRFMVQYRYAPNDATVADSDNSFVRVAEGVEIHHTRLNCVFELSSKSEDHLPSSTNDSSAQPALTSSRTQYQDDMICLELESLHRRFKALMMENFESKKQNMELTKENMELKKENIQIKKENMELNKENMDLKEGIVKGRSNET